MISQRDSGELARFYTVTDPKKHQKGYTVYKVTARIISRKNPEDVQEITVWKRYSDFRKLHQNLWQLHKNVCSQSELFPPFAKAKVFGRFDDSVIEERRQCSEDLLQFSANIPALYSTLACQPCAYIAAHLLPQPLPPQPLTQRSLGRAARHSCLAL
uniref:Ribosomal protein S6 kinase polypeptide 1 n=1 Tax=Cynoglossus semilaevis TaxID=244447 RepID=A0A3P8WXB9_CYNSE